jgi:hypothetical protein
VLRFKRHSYDHKRTWFSAVISHYKGDQLHTQRSDVAPHNYRAKLCLKNAEDQTEVFSSTVAHKSLKWAGPSPRPNQSRVAGEVIIEKVIGSEVIELYRAPIVLYQKRSLGERLVRSTLMHE